MTQSSTLLFACLLLSPLQVAGQQAALPPAPPDDAITAAKPESSQPPAKEAKRLLWVIPNYRTAPSIKDFEPISPKEKFKIASQDSFDRGTMALAAMFAGVGQLSNSNPALVRASRDTDATSARRTPTWSLATI